MPNILVTLDPLTEPLSDEYIVELGTWLPPQEQIVNMINSGQLLHNYRQGIYDEHLDDPDYMGLDDPSRIPNYDLADYSYDIEYLQNLMDTKEAAARSEAERKAARELNMSDVKNDPNYDPPPPPPLDPPTPAPPSGSTSSSKAKTAT